MNLTLEDIGRLAGVSRSTVSRVINDQANVSSDVRERVHDVIRRTGYSPNIAARSLVSGRTGVIGLVIPSGVHALFDDPYFGRLIQGISAASNECGNTLALYLFQNEEEEAQLHPRVISAGTVDGLILTATRMSDPLMARMTGSNLPMVMIGRPDTDGVSYVNVDNRNGGFQAASHLCKQGYRRIGILGGPASTSAGTDRLDGFVEGLASHGRHLDPSLRMDGDFSQPGGYEAMQQLIPNRPDALFVASDTMAIGALRALREHNIRVPHDIALIGFDGIRPPADSAPTLTTIRQPVTETGERAVHILNGLVSGSATAPVVEILPVELVMRESCPAAGMLSEADTH